MACLRRSLICLGLVYLGGSIGCRPEEESPSNHGSGGSEPDEPRCGMDQQVSLTAGKGVGAVFMPFQDGDPIVPYFGSQIGMEVEISVRLTGFDPQEITSLEVRLNVDGAPIGEDSFSPSELFCDGNESATIETALLIDVTDHPTVTSVVQLNGRDAEIEVLVETPDGSESATAHVVIEL